MKLGYHFQLSSFLKQQVLLFFKFSQGLQNQSEQGKSLMLVKKNVAANMSMSITILLIF